MKYLKFILVISFMTMSLGIPMKACGPYYPKNPNSFKIFRCCTPQLEQQWREGCRFQDYEKYENCMLWQNITSPSIPLADIEEVVYTSRLSDVRNISKGMLADNQFAEWLSDSRHSEDLEYILIAKEIEEIRKYMNDVWYYPYDGDEEHLRLAELKEICASYNGNRHAERYALQLVRLYFAVGDFDSCIELWENSAVAMPVNIVTDMIASYVGGAYSRRGNRTKAIELFTRSQDIGSLISLKAWNNAEEKSEYSDSRIKELEYIFNRFPNSPLLSIKLQGYMRNREALAHYLETKDEGYLPDYYGAEYEWIGDSLIVVEDKAFYDELKRFANKVVNSKQCNQKGMWQYALGFLYYSDGDINKARIYAKSAENCQNTPFIAESIKAFQIFLSACGATNTVAYRSKLLKDLQWLDERLVRDVKPDANNNWRYDNMMNYSINYWQDVIRMVILSKLCPAMEAGGNKVLSLQLANYASNRLHQLVPYYPEGDDESLPYFQNKQPDEFRRTWSDDNTYDYSNQFFEKINHTSANQAAAYAQRIFQPVTELDKFLTARGYIETDYICEVVGTLYIREMNYEKATDWLSKVSSGYQDRTNIALNGYFDRDPFQYQIDKKQLIANKKDYKLRFAQEMVQLEKIINSDAEANRKANAKIKYATGLRNSFGRCWYLTEYGYDIYTDYDRDEYTGWCWYTSTDRQGFTDNIYAQKAYERVDSLMEQALAEFTDPEQAARAHLKMMNYATLVKEYPETKAAAYIRTRCDEYFDYALHKR